MAKTIYTIGHSVRPFEELVEILQRNGVTLLADVRAMPRSRFHPWFNRSYLEKNLPLKYQWFEALGGKNAKEIPPELFAHGIAELMHLADRETVCIMCSEREPTPTKWRKEGCHRWHTLTPALQKAGAKVVHL
jgi:uncharacterized protein (DUF488 family)